MATSRHSKPADNQQTGESAAPSRGSPSAPDPSPSMLDDVVAQTSERLATPQELSAAVRAALVEVARRYAGQPLTLDPAGIALVEALLSAEFAIFAERPPLLARTARAVAQSLLNDPEARLRLEHLWAQLGEECA